MVDRITFITFAEEQRVLVSEASYRGVASPRGGQHRRWPSKNGRLRHPLHLLVLDLSVPANVRGRHRITQLCDIDPTKT